MPPSPREDELLFNICGENSVNESQIIRGGFTASA